MVRNASGFIVGMGDLIQRGVMVIIQHVQNIIIDKPNDRNWI